MDSEIKTLYDLEPGKVLGDRYEVVRTFRQNELSTTFEVTDQRDSASREMHVFPAALFEEPAQIGEFVSAMQPWMRVQGSSVLPVREVATLGNAGCVVITDFPNGRALRELFSEAWPAADVVRIGRQILEGLVEVHTHGLVHGDIKPSTIFVAGEGAELQAQVVDGGITRGLWSAKDLGEKTALIGTPFYAPVEQFGGESPDIQSDVYNVATVLFELAAGVLPWPGRSFLEVFQAKLDKGAPSMRSRAPGVEVPSDLERAIVKGLLADKNERYATAGEFRAALNGVELE